MKIKDGNFFLVFEGLSGSGKTTIAELVAKSLGAEFYKTPAAPFDSIRDAIDVKVCLQARFLFYLAAVAQASSEISEILKQKSVVCDRYFLTTLCYHQAIGVGMDGISEPFTEILIQPDYTFLVVCDDEIRLQRLRDRGMSYNDIQERKSGVESLFLSKYREHSVIEIDNSCDGPEITAGKVVDLLKG
ncbi:MAG: AAA family ATPase [Methanosarcina sp.]|jgi:thymidylate kinase|nr:AAA family ATPase [Candidatus Paceibacterota bacterium]